MRLRLTRGAREPAGRVAMLVLVALSWAATARADATHGLRETLRVRSGATCLNAESLASQVQTWLQTDRVRSDIVIEVEGSAVDSRSATFRVVQAGRTTAHRTFSPGPARCEHLQAALGLSIALALKASLLDELGEPLDDDPAARARGVSLAGAGIVAVDVLPGLAAGAELRTDLALPPSLGLRVGVLGLGGFDKTFERATGRFDAGLLAARVDACAGLSLARDVRGRACMGVLVGPLYAAGESFVESKSSVVAWAAFVNSAGVLLDLSAHWSLELGVSLLAPLRRVRVGIHSSAGDVVDARDLSAVGFAAGLGPIYRL